MWTKVHVVSRRCRRLLVVGNALNRLSISCFISKIYAVKGFLELRSRPKKVSIVSILRFLGPRFVGGKDTTDFGHAFSNFTYFRPCVRFWLSLVQRARRLGGEKKQKESLVKHIVRRHAISGGLKRYSDKKDSDGESDKPSLLVYRAYFRERRWLYELRIDTIMFLLVCTVRRENSRIF